MLAMFYFSATQVAFRKMCPKLTHFVSLFQPPSRPKRSVNFTEYIYKSQKSTVSVLNDDSEEIKEVKF